jgi:AhpD family alkylhydroperoxidase
MSNTEESKTLCTPAVEELVAIGAAIAANCMPCLRYHVRKAESLGVNKEDLARAVAVGSAVKQVPANEIMQLADHLVEGRVAQAVKAQTCCSAGKASGGSVGEKTTSCAGTTKSSSCGSKG